MTNDIPEEADGIPILNRLGDIVGVTIVDARDFLALYCYDWYILKGRHTNYARRFEHNKRSILMHRMILNAPRGIEVDHIDGDGLNNTRANLRLCTRQQNSFRRREYKTKSSQYRGVSFNKAKGKWVANIKCNRRQEYLGCFDTEKEAARAYNQRAKVLYGEYAQLNLVEVT